MELFHVRFEFELKGYPVRGPQIVETKETLPVLKEMYRSLQNGLNSGAVSYVKVYQNKSNGLGWIEIDPNLPIGAGNPPSAGLVPPSKPLSYDYFTGDYYHDSADNFPDSKECSHDWKLYQGLRECYHYCTKCDQKKETP